MQNGTVLVEIKLDGPPLRARPDLSVEGTIELERLDDVLYVGRPCRVSRTARWDCSGSSPTAAMRFGSR